MAIVLTRCPTERIMIGDDIIVQVVRVDGKKVRLAITAPPEVLVDREEVRRARERHSEAKP